MKRMSAPRYAEPPIRWNRGEPIYARRLNGVVDRLGVLSRGLLSPRQIFEFRPKPREPYRVPPESPNPLPFFYVALDYAPDPYVLGREFVLAKRVIATEYADGTYGAPYRVTDVDSQYLMVLPGTSHLITPRLLPGASEGMLVTIAHLLVHCVRWEWWPRSYMGTDEEWHWYNTFYVFPAEEGF